MVVLLSEELSDEVEEELSDGVVEELSAVSSEEVSVGLLSAELIVSAAPEI